MEGIFVHLHTDSIINDYRKNSARTRYLGQIDDSEETLILNIIEQETRSLLYTAINNLPEIYRAIFDLSFEQGLKNAEVVQHLQVAEITVKKNKTRMIELLRTELKGKIDDTSLTLLLIMMLK